MNVVAWLKAARPPSQSYIALPLLLGQLLAWRATDNWSWAIFVWVQLFGVFDQLYIVFANDYADQETDALNRTSTIFSGGSRVLVDGSLAPRALFRAAALMAFLALGTGVALVVGWDRTASLPLMAAGIALLWAYSYAPLRMSYRGGGELLQMLGVGLVLPLIGFEAQAGSLAAFPWAALAFLLPLNLATSLSTALPDEPSDRASEKRTAAVLLGGPVARGVVIGLNALGLGLFVAVAPAVLGSQAEPYVAGLLFIPAAALAVQLLAARRAAPGSRAILLFVFFSLLCNLSLVAGLCLLLAPI